MNKYKGIILFVIVLVSTISVILVNVDLNISRKEDNKILKEDKIISKPSSIQAYTLEGEKTNLSYDLLIKNNLINGITCKNGTVATFNNLDNTINLSNVKIPDYCTMDFKHSFYSKLLSDNSTIKTRTDFSTPFTETSPNTLYTSTESISGSDTKTVYYFAGNAQNNWVKFAGYYWRIIRTNADGSVRLLYSGTSTSATDAYVGETVFNSTNNSPKYIGYMYGNADTTLADARANTNDSAVKSVIDTWYKNNLSSYSSYLSNDAVYCNDREIGNGTYNLGESVFYFASYRRNDFNLDVKPTYNCTNIKDAFSVNNTEAKLTYPIALMTMDEAIFAGGFQYKGADESYSWYYTNSNGDYITNTKDWWLISPGMYDATKCDGTVVKGSDNYAYLSVANPISARSVRPVISLKANLLWKSGDGSANSPYEVEEAKPTLISKILSDNPTVSERTDFSEGFTDTTTGTIYKATEKNVHNTSDATVYYYAGNTTNNWVKFAGFYWRIIRTNADGSVRLLYSGTKSEGTAGSSAHIGGSMFNTNADNPMYVGYKYGTSGSLANNRQNTTDSTIKGVIDNWYKNNLTSFTNYLSTTAVYCNDRNEQDEGSYNLGDTTFYFASRYRAYTSFVPTYDCTASADAFSASNASAKLTYPIALMTVDEVMYAGGKSNTSLTSPYAWFYLNSEGESITGGYWWWIMSPVYWYTNIAHVLNVGNYVYPGYIAAAKVNTTPVVRPVISVKSCVQWKSGNGTAESPYEIALNGGC